MVSEKQASHFSSVPVTGNVRLVCHGWKVLSVRKFFFSRWQTYFLDSAANCPHDLLNVWSLKMFEECSPFNLPSLNPSLPTFQFLYMWYFCRTPRNSTLKMALTAAGEILDVAWHNEHRRKMTFLYLEILLMTPFSSWKSDISQDLC